MDNIVSIMQSGLFALACLILAALLKEHRNRILLYAADLINKAEEAVQGSGMGEEKKTMVIAQLEAAGIHVDEWLADQIDRIVELLNTNGAWFAGQTKIR